MEINRIVGGAIVMAGSGMCTGGRIRHHLRHNLWRSDASVVFVGFAAVGTLAHKIIDGARLVRIFEEEIPVRARVHTINGFSGHADQQGLPRRCAPCNDTRMLWSAFARRQAASPLRCAAPEQAHPGQCCGQ